MERAVQQPQAAPAPKGVPPLEAGDHLDRAEYHRRYSASPEGLKAELIEGVVYMPSPAGEEHHGAPWSRMDTCLGCYAAFTPGVRSSTGPTVLLDDHNEPEPDLVLRILPGHGGQSSSTDPPKSFIRGAPELAVEVAASNVTIALREKKQAYERCGVKEYLVWRAFDAQIDWFVLRDGAYTGLEPDSIGIYRSSVFPGLWVDSRALLRGDMARVLAVLLEGIDSPEHEAFCERLAGRAGG